MSQRKPERAFPMAADMALSAEPEYTGRSIVIFKEHEGESAAKAASRIHSVLADKAGVKDIASVMDFGVQSYDADKAAAAQAVGAEHLGIAVVNANDDQVAAMAMESAATGGEIEAVVPERYDYLMTDGASQAGFGPTDLSEEIASALNAANLKQVCKLLKFLSQLCDSLAPDAIAPTEVEAAAAAGCFADTSAATWGLQATRVPTSSRSGAGVKVAVLDTGIDQSHPDFRGRRIVTNSFVPGIPARPTHPHGTHVAGTACGPRRPTSGPRYGIAFNSEIFALKVFNDVLPRPGAPRGAVIAAIGAANLAGCRIINLSLGGRPDGSVDIDYDRAISRARALGSLVVAATGNESALSSAPSTSPDAMAVAAVDQCLRHASFSNRGKVEIAGPGVGVLSAILGGRTGQFNGTSMATPHVAGIAALWLEANRSWTPDQLELALQRTARPLSQSPNLVGRGLVQAPA